MSADELGFHPVLPQITDPDLAPPIALCQTPVIDSTTSGSMGFFKTHKVAIIIAIVILLIVIVVIFMMYSKRHKTADSTMQKDVPNVDNGTVSEKIKSSDEINKDEIIQLRAMRKAVKSNPAQTPAPVQVSDPVPVVTNKPTAALPPQNPVSSSVEIMPTIEEFDTEVSFANDNVIDNDVPDNMDDLIATLED